MEDTQRTEPDNERRERPLLLPCFYFVEVPLFGAAIVLAYILHFTAVFSTIPVIYDPSDVTLSRPFTPEKNRTARALTIFLITSLTPCIMVAAVECFLVVFTICCKFPVDPPVGSTGCYISATLRRIIRFIGIYLFGLLITSALCDILRKRLAILSPHFLSVCKPEAHRSWGSTVPDYSESEPNPLKIFSRFFSDDCSLRVGADELHTARLDSPSYFVSLASYASIYTMMYLRLIVIRSGPVVATIVLCFSLLFPYLVGLIEIAENTSHISSVMYGWVLGSMIAYLFCHEIFSSGFIPKCKCPTTCMARKKKNDNTTVNNVFEDDPTPKFSMRGYDVGKDDNVSELGSTNREEEPQEARQPSKADGRHELLLPSPAASKNSQTAVDQTEDRNKGHTAERKMIKELQTYITDTEVRGGLESPRPAQIRELSRGTTQQNRKQVFSTFQATPEIEVHDDFLNQVVGQSVPEDLHAPGNTYEFISGFHKAPPFEGRPFSYHGRKSSQSSDGSSIGARLEPPGMDGRPMSFAYRPRSIQESTSRETITEDGEGILSYFANEGKPDLLDIGGNKRVGSAFQSVQKVHRSPSDDIVDEAAILLKEVYNAMSDHSGSKQSDSDSINSDETITEDQPSIAV